MQSALLKMAGMALLITGMGSALSAFAIPTPEIDGATAGNALVLLGGAVLLIRGRKKR
jgi:hypothetical protein